MRFDFNAYNELFPRKEQPEIVDPVDAEESMLNEEVEEHKEEEKDGDGANSKSDTE